MQKKLLRLFFFFLCFYFFTALYANDENEQITLTFSQAAELAVKTSIDLKHSQAAQKIMEKTLLSGIWRYFPRFSVSVSENDRLQQLGADSFTKNYGISAEQLVFDGGRTRLSRNIERTELKISSSKIERMESETAESAISAYRNVLSSSAILEIKKAALKILEEQLNILREEVLLGLALPVDYSSAQINLADSKLDIYSLQLDLTEMKRQFAELLGLDSLPVLTESVDINRASVFPAAAAASALAKEQNPDLAEARYAIMKKTAELKYASRSWIPALRLTGNFGLSGQEYPLTRFNWSIGINVDLSSPWIQNKFGIQTGWESSLSDQYDKTAVIQNAFTPFIDPPSRFGRKQAKLALSLEKEKYNDAYERIGRTAANAVEKCALAEQKRILALETAAVGEEKCKIEEIRLSLGQITRLELMEILIEQTTREIAAVEAAAYLLEAERELERFLDLKPGELSNFAVYAAETEKRRH